MDKQEALRKIEELKEFVKELDSKPSIDKLYQKYLRFHPNFPYSLGISHDNRCHIRVPLPTSNSAWTYDAWDYVRRFCSENPGAYPVHRDEHDNSNFVYIDCCALLT